jgi:hypothetical protein
VTLMRLTRASMKNAGFSVVADELFMAFSENMIVPQETRIYGLHCVRMVNLAQRLREVDAKRENVNRRELPDEHDEQPLSPLTAPEEPGADPMMDTIELQIVELTDGDQEEVI